MRLARLLGVLIVAPALVAVTLVDAGIGSAEPEQVTTNATFHNDASVPGADPYVLHDANSGYYYAYSTEGADRGYRFAIYRSPDMSTWEHLPGGALRMSDGQWGKDWFWAPEVYHNSETGLYYLFYSARMGSNVAEHFRYADFEEPSKIGVAVASTPEGPFRNIVNRPLDYYPYDPDYHDVNLIMDETQKKPPDTREEGETAPLGTYIPFIDPNVFFDDGRVFLYYSRNAYRNWVWDDDLGKYIEEANIYVVELTTGWWNDPRGATMPEVHPRYVNTHRAPDDPPGVRKDGFTRVLDYGSDKQQWENAHVNDYENSGGKFKNRRWEEGSTTVKATTSDGRAVYFLLYSANNFANAYYGVGYAVADSPLGPWKKSPANPVLAQDEEQGMYSTGHGSPVASPDGTRLYYVHHGRPETGVNRRLYTASLTIDADAAKLAIGQTTGDQPMPPGVAPYALNTDTRLVELGADPARLKWTVTSAGGAALNLANPLNRVRLSLRPQGAVQVDRGPGEATFTGDPRGVVAARLDYQRKPARGEFFGIDNITGAGTPNEQHRPVGVTVPITRCDRTVNAVHIGTLSLDQGVTCLRSATVEGDLRVRSGASVVAIDSEIRGSVRADGSGTAWLRGTRVRDDVVVERSSGIVRLDGAHIGGSVTLNGNQAPVITDSTVEGSLSCMDNEPVPSDEGRRNVVHGPVRGQCTTM